MAKPTIEKKVPLAPLTTLELGGVASYFARPSDDEETLGALRWAADRMTPIAILAGGSNTIVPDKGFRGLVLQPASQGIALEDDPSNAERALVRVAAGASWPDAVSFAVARDLAGIECLAGIPGSVGAVPIQNVGAYGQEVSNTITEVRAIDRETLDEVRLSPAECEFAYRDSRLKRERHRFLVLEVTFALTRGGAPTIRYAELERALEGVEASLSKVAETVVALRRRKSMVLDPDDPNRRSAGSFFTNPIVDASLADQVEEVARTSGALGADETMPRYAQPDGRVKLAAGWLIERAGAEKGMREGAFGLSTAHALAIVHHGGGTTEELLRFADGISGRVSDAFGVALEREPQILEGVMA